MQVEQLKALEPFEEAKAVENEVDPTAKPNDQNDEETIGKNVKVEESDQVEGNVI